MSNNWMFPFVISLSWTLEERRRCCPVRPACWSPFRVQFRASIPGPAAWHTLRRESRSKCLWKMGAEYVWGLCITGKFVFSKQEVLVSGLIDWLFDLSCDRLIDWFIMWLIDWLFDLSCDWLIGWLIDWLGKKIRLFSFFFNKLKYFFQYLNFRFILVQSWAVSVLFWTESIRWGRSKLCFHWSRLCLKWTDFSFFFFSSSLVPQTGIVGNRRPWSVRQRSLQKILR